MLDREKVIKSIEVCIGGDCCSRDCCSGCGYNLPDYHTKACNCWEQMMTDALALLKEQGWNVLTEDADGVIHGLPGDDGQYLMTDGKDIWIDDYVDGVTDGIFLGSGKDIREITAWMYMPELPKKDRR